MKFDKKTHGFTRTKTEKIFQKTKQCVQPHIDSFNYAFTHGLKKICDEKNYNFLELPLTNNHAVKLYYSDLVLKKPIAPTSYEGGYEGIGTGINGERKLYPCLSRKVLDHYCGNLQGRFRIEIFKYIKDKPKTKSKIVPEILEKKRKIIFEKNVFIPNITSVPIMVKSKFCHLHNIEDPDKLISLGEEPFEMGGYFIINGREKCSRLLITLKRNFPFLLSNTQIQVQSYRDDEVIRKNYIFYTEKENSMSVGFGNPKIINFPLILVLKALKPNITDKTIFDLFSSSFSKNSGEQIDMIKNCLKIGNEFNAKTQNDYIKLIGETFQKIFLKNFQTHFNKSNRNGTKFQENEEINIGSYTFGKRMIERDLLPHCKTLEEKFDFIIFSVQKLFKRMQRLIELDDRDEFIHQAPVTPGTLFLNVLNISLKRRAQFFYQHLLQNVNRTLRRFRNSTIDTMTLNNIFSKIDVQYTFNMNPSELIRVCSMGTFPFVSLSKLCFDRISFPHLAGIVTPAEKLNYLRYIAHFRSIHRGPDLMESKNTKPRKLTPSHFGFICCVHTPDGAPCGLLNHLSSTCNVYCGRKLSGVHESAYKNNKNKNENENENENESYVSDDLNYDNDYDKRIYNDNENEKNLEKTLTDLGMTPTNNNQNSSIFFSNETFPIFLNGRIIGKVPKNQINLFAKKLRYLKVRSKYYLPNKFNESGITKTTDISVYPYQGDSLLQNYIPCIMINNDFSRFIRPVLNIESLKIEFISPLEQAFLTIAITDENIKNHPNSMITLTDEKGKNLNVIETNKNKHQILVLNETTHREILPTAFLSNIANLTPFSDFNQSPRNVYQCQMGKQSMALPCLSFQHRTDTKMYRVYSPQRPITQTRYQEQESLPFNYYLNGTNAVVAVLSYTGYDMEDAMIINKSAFERGLAHGCVIKHEIIDLYEKNPEVNKEQFKLYFNNTPQKDSNDQNLFFKNRKEFDSSGLPNVGTIIKKGEPLCVYYDEFKQRHKTINSHTPVGSIIDSVKVLPTKDGNSLDNQYPSKIEVTYRVKRNPQIGDKFSSRHGQKGVCSILWPQEDLPFTESGLTPDIIINPHAFPSRMTIGMLIETMSSKLGAIHGTFPDATPFSFSEKETAIDFFGKQLKKSGYNYYGNETMYSGTQGKEFKADIFMGIVYYQRLRHMVNDKFQSRTGGKIDQLTHQPIKGRKKGGGVRFGEMERDALIGHGTSFLLRDRLFVNSDQDWSVICKKCGSMLSTSKKGYGSKGYYCKSCESSNDLTCVPMPYVAKYLAHELAAMNIKMKFGFK